MEPKGYYSNAAAGRRGSQQPRPQVDEANAQADEGVGAAPAPAVELVPVDAIEATLGEIFDFYASRPYTNGNRAVMKSMKFQKMALDADLIDDVAPLNSARVDLIFKKLCGNSPHMTFEQFMNACVQLALTKYPMKQRAHEALTLLYSEHFSKFANPHQQLFNSLDADFFDEITPLKEGIFTLYHGYFATENNPHFKQAVSSLESQSMKAFVNCEFE